jgi:hypothetical protein
MPTARYGRLKTILTPEEFFGDVPLRGYFCRKAESLCQRSS